MQIILSGNLQVISNNFQQFIPLTFVTMLIDIEINRFILWWKFWICKPSTFIFIALSLVYLLNLLDLLFFPPISRCQDARVLFLDSLVYIFPYVFLLLNNIEPLQYIMHFFPLLLNHLFHLFNLILISFSLIFNLHWLNYSLLPLLNLLRTCAGAKWKHLHLELMIHFLHLFW